MVLYVSFSWKGLSDLVGLGTKWVIGCRAHFVFECVDSLNFVVTLDLHSINGEILLLFWYIYEDDASCRLFCLGNIVSNYMLMEKSAILMRLDKLDNVLYYRRLSFGQDSSSFGS